MAAQLGEHLLFTADVYQINITDRIIDSERLIKSNIKALQTPDFAGISEIRFFTNAIDTRTRGLDVVATYKTEPSERSRLSASLALTLNATNIVRTSATPAALQAGTANRILLIDTVSIGLIERAQPRQKVLVSLTYQLGKFSLTPRASYFGPVTAYEKPANRTVNGAVVYAPHISQVFSGKTLFDLALVYTRRGCWPSPWGPITSPTCIPTAWMPAASAAIPTARVPTPATRRSSASMGRITIRM